MKKKNKKVKVVMNNDSKKGKSKYAQKKKSGCEINHSKHKNKVAWCKKCFPNGV